MLLVIHFLKCISFYFSADISQTSLASDIAVSCLERMVLEFQSQHLDYSIEVAKMIFPLLLVLPKVFSLCKIFSLFLLVVCQFSFEIYRLISFSCILQTWRVNLKTLELVNKVKWSFYAEISTAHNSVKFDQMKVLKMH